MNDLTERLRKASFQEWQEYPSAHIQGAKWPVTSNIGEEAAEEIDRLTAALAEARDKALEEAAKVADAHASTCLSKLNKKRSDHDLAVFESAASEAQSIAHVVRALKEKP